MRASLLVLVLGGCGAPAASDAATLEDRIDRLLDRMTLDQKVRQLHRQGHFNTPDDPVLGIPGFAMADGPHGVGSGNGPATSFPVGIGMAATWDEDLVRRVGEAIGKEMRGLGKNQALAPCVDLMRDPRAGRSPESAGEDPFLAARLAAAYVAGLQGTSCIATVKHFSLSSRETNRMEQDYRVDDRTLAALYAAPFRAAVQEGGAWSVMSAYGRFNGPYASESKALLGGVLREGWGYPYSVVSDWAAVTDAGRAITAGTDVEMGSDHYRERLRDLVLEGTVPVAALDAAVGRVLLTKLVSGMIDGQPLADRRDVDSEAHRQLALEAARKSIVLLRNEERTLPLDAARLGSIAVVGPSADVARLDGHGSSVVQTAHAPSPLAALRRRLEPGVTVRHARGCGIHDLDRSGFAAALDAARASDVVVYIGGLDETMEGEERDRANGSIDLPGVQCELIAALARANPRLVVVLEGGGAIGVRACAGSMRALLHAFYPGEEGGTAIAEVLLGAVNPSGKLPYTIPRSDDQLPPWDADLRQDLARGRGYRWFDRQGLAPEFPFGHGLSYTSFRYADLRVPARPVPSGEVVEVTASVTNSGPVAGDEVAELYLARGSAGGSAGASTPKELAGFRRLGLEPGETRTVRFELGPERFYRHDAEAGSLASDTGAFTVWLGGSSRDVPLSASFTVSAARPRPDLVVTRLSWVPPHPRWGEPLHFFATVANRGTGPTLAGQPIAVVFEVAGKEIARAARHARPLAPGQMAVLHAVPAPGTTAWTAPRPGSYPVGARVNPGGAIAETQAGNNATAATLLVREPNLAARRPVRVSSAETEELDGSRAVDGFNSTRWSSHASDPQSIDVDLGRQVELERVVLVWDFGYATEYRVQVSGDGQRFTDVHHETGGDGGIDELAVQASGRHLRVLGLQRNIGVGYSLREIEVAGTPVEIQPERGQCGDSLDNDEDGAADCEDADCAGTAECPGLAVNRRIVITPTGVTPRRRGQFDASCRQGEWTLCAETALPASGQGARLAGEASASPALPGLGLYQRSGSGTLLLTREGGDVVAGW